jgi:hypothetical protein
VVLSQACIGEPLSESKLRFQSSNE